MPQIESRLCNKIEYYPDGVTPKFVQAGNVAIEYYHDGTVKSNLIYYTEDVAPSVEMLTSATEIT